MHLQVYKYFFCGRTIDEICFELDLTFAMEKSFREVLNKICFLESCTVLPYDIH